MAWTKQKIAGNGTNIKQLPSSSRKHGSSLQRAILLLVITAFLSAPILAAEMMASQKECEYPEYTTSRQIPPNQHLGEFEIPLTAPDFDDLPSVRLHLAYSTIWRNFLESQLSDQTAKFCRAFISPTRFPHFRAIPYVAGSREPSGADRLRCLDALREILRNSTPTSEAVKQIANREAYWKKLQLPSNPLSVYDIIPIALTHIYRAGTFMHALVSVDETVFASLNPKLFLEWLQNQRSVGRFGDLVPIQTDCARERGPQQFDLPRTYELPRSSFIAPGRIDLSFSKMGDGSKRPPRHTVIVGNDFVPPNALFYNAATQKYCNQERVFAVAGAAESARGLRLRIRCRTEGVFESDSWTAFYCDPSDCPSDDAAEIAMTAITNDPIVIEVARGHSGAAQPRGPYEIILQEARR